MKLFALFSFIFLIASNNGTNVPHIKANPVFKVLHHEPNPYLDKKVYDCISSNKKSATILIPNSKPKLTI